MGIMEFMQKVAEDKEFAAKYQALSSAEAILAQAKEDGYSIVKEELEAAIQKAKSGELSDGALEDASGGAYPTWNCARWDYARIPSP